MTLDLPHVSALPTLLFGRRIESGNPPPDRAEDGAPRRRHDRREASSLLPQHYTERPKGLGARYQHKY